MTTHPTPLERLIDALQAALLTAQTVEQIAHEQADDASQLRNLIARAGQHVQELRPDKTGGNQ
jgi:hypothetical protein